MYKSHVVGVLWSGKKIKINKNELETRLEYLDSIIGIRDFQCVYQLRIDWRIFWLFCELLQTNVISKPNGLKVPIGKKV